MPPETATRPARFTITPAPTEIEIISEPYVLVTFKGYAPVVKARKAGSTEEMPLFIGSKSLTDGLEILREANHGRFTGIKCSLRKESDEKFSKYVVEPV